MCPNAQKSLKILTRTPKTSKLAVPCLCGCGSSKCRALRYSGGALWGHTLFFAKLIVRDKAKQPQLKKQLTKSHEPSQPTIGRDKSDPTSKFQSKRGAIPNYTIPRELQADRDTEIKTREDCCEDTGPRTSWTPRRNSTKISPRSFHNPLHTILLGSGWHHLQIRGGLGSWFSMESASKLHVHTVNFSYSNPRQTGF